MAVSKVPQTTQLTVKVQTGVTSGGNPAYKQRIFKNVKTTAADADIFAVGQELAGLQQHTVAGIARVDNGNLVSE